MTSMTAFDLQQLLATEPFVRALARSLVAEDADEVVQQTWLRALRRTGPRVREPWHWLACIVRSVAANLHRADARRRTHEAAAARPERVPSSLRLFELEETRRSLLAAVDALPAELRSVVLLRYYDGLPPRAIARELGVPVAVVWRQLQRALALLRARLGAATPGRRAWISALVPLAQAPRGLPWRELVRTPPPMFWTGVLAMTTKGKVVGATAALLAISIALMLWQRVPADPASPRAGASGQPVGARSGAPPAADPAAATPPTGREAASAADPALTTTGKLVVHVRYADDGAAAADVQVLAWPSGRTRELAQRRQGTDASGTVVFDRLPPERILATTGRDLNRIEVAELTAGGTTVLELALAGFTLSGTVVDAAGSPVAGAIVELVPPVATLPEPVATTGSDGRFRVRAVGTPNLVGARAAGHASSECTVMLSGDGNPGEIQLVLPAAGGEVEGLVVGPDGPVANAVVQVGQLGGAGTLRKPPQPAVVRSDDEGRFRAIGLAAGDHPVQVRLAGFGPWRGTCRVAERHTTSLQVRLQRGATIRGVVRDAAGAVVPGAVVGGGSRADPLGWSAARSRRDGTFVLGDLAEGEVELSAAEERAGKASQRVHATAGGVTECELRLSRGLELRGRVLDEAGEPVAGASVQGRTGAAESDAVGRFAIANCPEDGMLTVEVRRQGFETRRFTDLDPRTGEVELRLQPMAAPSARLTGLVVDPSGSPLAGLVVAAGRTGEWVGARKQATTGADGRFELGPLVPGAWWLSIEAAGYPDFEKGPVELAASAALDVGTFQLLAGGTARVRLAGGDTTGVKFQVHGRSGSHFSELQLGGGELTSQLLAPGDYELRVSGNGTAEQTVPFAIRAAETTRFELQLARGVRQQFEVAVRSPDGGPIELLVRRGAETVRLLGLGAPRNPGNKRSGEAWLAPGSYTVTATCRALTATVPFTVGSAEGPLVQLELR